MPVPGHSRAGGDAGVGRVHPLVAGSVAVVLGMVVGWATGGVTAWLVLAGVSLMAGCGAGWVAWRTRWAGGWRVAGFCSLLGVFACAAGWWTLATGRIAADGVERFVTVEGGMVRVRGTVRAPVMLTTSERGPFGAYNFNSPGTLFVLDLRGVDAGGGMESATGRLVGKVDEVDPTLEAGMVVEGACWLNPLRPPRNPGEVDYRQLLLEEGIAGRVTFKSRGNVRVVESGGATLWDRVATVRERVASAAVASLRLGLVEEGPVGDVGEAAPDPARALLEAVLLGRWSPDMEELQERFRRVGLAHLLSISGAHLAILLWLAWLVCRLLIAKPSRAAAVVLVVLGLYLTAVPLRVPIVRAAVMAGVMLLGVAAGRRFGTLGLLSLAAAVVLIWRPGDLTSAGFQLSFVAVGALLAFTEALAERMCPASLRPLLLPESAAGVQAGHGTIDAGMGGAVLPTGHQGVGAWFAGWLLRYAAASVVAFLAVLPLVVYHFGLVSPLAVLLSVLSLPVFTAVLAVGYAKVLIGLVMPSVGLLLGGPLRWLAGTMASLVAGADAWPGASVAVSSPVSAWWVAGVMAVGGTGAARWLGLWRTRRTGLLRHRRRLRVERWVVWPLAVLVMTLWTLGSFMPLPSPGGVDNADRAIDVHMLSVGDGSCYVVRVAGDKTTPPFTLMFDCGSSAYLDVGERSVAPALATLGVHRLDLLIVSHADLDHYVGVLDVADAVTVDAVGVPPTLLEEAGRDPGGATARLVEGLRLRGIEPAVIEAGWTRPVPGGELRALWPTQGYRPKRSNDGSIVLRIASRGRRVLLFGDAQQEALTALLREPMELRADVIDLPHHGSFVEASPALLAAATPAVVLQSSSMRQGRRDPWAALTRSPDGGNTMPDRPPRLISDKLGMVSVMLPNVVPQGSAVVRWESWLGGGGEAGAPQEPRAE